MKIIYLLPFLALIGCSESDGNNHGYGYRVDAYDPQYGVSVQYGEGAYQYPVEKISQAFLEVQECMNTWHNGIMIVIRDADIAGDWYGLTYFDPLLVVTSDGYLYYDNQYILKHEIVHYLLSVSGFDEAGNIAHESDHFLFCT